MSTLVLLVFSGNMFGVSEVLHHHHRVIVVPMFTRTVWPNYNDLKQSHDDKCMFTAESYQHDIYAIRVDDSTCNEQVYQMIAPLRPGRFHAHPPWLQEVGARIGAVDVSLMPSWIYLILSYFDLGLSINGVTPEWMICQGQSH